MTIKSTIEPGVALPSAVRPKWRAPQLTEAAIPDATALTAHSPGSDGIDASNGGAYVTYGNHS
jgi:hypothetical protein